MLGGVRLAERVCLHHLAAMPRVRGVVLIPVQRFDSDLPLLHTRKLAMRVLTSLLMKRRPYPRVVAER